MNEIQMNNLEKVGFNRWSKYGYDRLYISIKNLGFECTYYGTGNIRTAYLDGKRISNSWGRYYDGAIGFIDLKTGEAYSKGENTFRCGDKSRWEHVDNQVRTRTKDLFDRIIKENENEY